MGSMRLCTSCFSRVRTTVARNSGLRVSAPMAIVLILATGSPGLAHHGPGPFDQADTITLDEAVVESFRYVNPHALITVRAPDEAGRMVEWEVETESPNILRRSGVYADFLSPGETVTIDGYFHRTVPRRVKLKTVSFSDGRLAQVRRDARNNTPLFVDLRDAEAADPGWRLEGIWVESDGPDWQNQQPTAAAREAMSGFVVEEDPTRRCVAPGFPRAADQPAGLEIIEQDHQVVLIYETWHNVRRIYTDGRRPGPHTISTRMGYSVGYWEGETLVAETSHLLPMLLTWDGHPISGGDTTRIVERISRNGNELIIGYTLEDPVNWMEPLTRVVTYRFAPDLEIVDYHCDPVDALDWNYPD